MATHRDIYIDKGTDYSQVIELTVLYADYDFAGAIRKSYASSYAVPFVFSAVENYPRKCRLTISNANTALIETNRAGHGIYDIFATNKDSGEIHKEQEGSVFLSLSVTEGELPLPPPDYQIDIGDILGIGTAAESSIDDFATAVQGELADSALQPADIGVSVAPQGDYIEEGDTRLTNARTPLSHTHLSADVTDASSTTFTGVGKVLKSSGSGGLTLAELTLGNPESGSLPIVTTVDGTAGFPNPTFHLSEVLSPLTQNRVIYKPDKDGTYALTSDLHAPATVVTGTGLSISGQQISLAIGTTAGTVAAGDDARLSAARTPTAHKTSHATGGSDALTPSDIGAAPALGTDDNYVTDAEKIVIGNTSGTNTGDNSPNSSSATAAQGALADTALQPGTVDAADLDYAGSTEIGAALVDADEIMVSDGGGNTTRRKTLVSRIWTYIKAQIDAGQTWAGVHAFSSTTRPTSAGTGTPAATSLITLADGDGRYGVMISKLSTAQMDATSGTLADITGLTGFSLEANAIYRVEFHAKVTTTANASYRFELFSSQDLAVQQTISYAGHGFTSNNTGAGSTARNWIATTSARLSFISWVLNNAGGDITAYGIIRTGANAPTISFRFAQGSTVAGTVSVPIGAVGVITRIA